METEIKTHEEVRKVWNCHAGYSHQIGCPHEERKMFREKDETSPRMIEAIFQTNECPKCSEKIVLEKFIGFDEGSDKWNGKELFIGFCESNCPYVFYIPIIKLDLSKDYRLVKID